MNKIIALLLLVPLLASCANGRSIGAFVLKDCDGSNGKDVTIRYGDSHIDITHKVKVKQDEKIVLKLVPEKNADSGIDYENLEIELIGKTANDSWLDRRLKASDGNKKKTICVDNEAPGNYKYSVKVPGVGDIDPRVEVQPK